MGAMPVGRRPPTSLPSYVALLRAVNLGGSSQVSMSALRELLVQLKCRDVHSLLQSGNLVFRTESIDGAQLERRLEAEVAKDFERPIDIFVRTAPEWRAIVSANPFPGEAQRDPGHLLVTWLKDAPTGAAWRELAAAIVGSERVRGRGREAYIHYPDGVGGSRLTATLIERKLGTRGTSRNWNTVKKIEALLSTG